MSDRGRLRGAFLVSAAIHLSVGVGIWYGSSQMRSEPSMRIYAVNIMSPPPQEEGPPSPGTPGTEPEPDVEPEPEPETPPEPEPEPEPEPTPTPAPPQRRPEPQPEPPPRREPTPEPPRQEPERPARPSTGANPDPSSTGGDNINTQLRGVQCPTADYCNNIVRQINRYFRSPGGSGVADIYFVINRDGSISGLRLENSSGSAAFRLAVLEAVEQAGINRAFGRLPAAFQSDQLPVSFFFRPAR